VNQTPNTNKSSTENSSMPSQQNEGTSFRANRSNRPQQSTTTSDALKQRIASSQNIMASQRSSTAQRPAASTRTSAQQYGNAQVPQRRQQAQPTTTQRQQTVRSNEQIRRSASAAASGAQTMDYEEKRRRLEAARREAMRMNNEEELRKRKAEQEDFEAIFSDDEPKSSVHTSRVSEDERAAALGANAQYSNRVTSHSTKSSRKKKFRLNVGAIIFLVLIVALIGISIHQIVKNLPNNDQTDDSDKNNEVVDDQTDDTKDSESASESESDSESTGEEDPPVTMLFDTVLMDQEKLGVGKLVLVNYQHAYASADTTETVLLYGNRTGAIKIANSSIALTRETLTALEKLVLGLTEATGCDDLMVVSGYRNTAEQQSVYDSKLAANGEEYAKNYVAQPGFSEHHTGLACDLTFFTDDGATIPITDHQYGSWLKEHGDEYGFIERYPKDKVEITKTAYEAWHYRYVGVPHALAVNNLGLCWEEYSEIIKNYTFDTRMMHISPDGIVKVVETAELPVEGGGWLTYYVPSAAEGQTEVKIPRGDLYSNYEVEGNNADGWIVTITLG